MFRALAPFLAVFTSLIALLSIAQAKVPPDVDSSARNLMVVLRESEGRNQEEERLVPVGKSKVTLADGKVVELDNAWFEYLGDMHVRFVFDAPRYMANAGPEDLQRLKLTPQQALTLAVENVKRVYGKPKAEPFAGGIMSVSGRSADMNSSYFLDREFWKELDIINPGGLVVAPVKRGGLLYAPASDTVAVEALRRNVGKLYRESDRMRISSGLYLFKDGRWSVFQAPGQAK
jgi:hypothetical protein